MDESEKEGKSLADLLKREMQARPLDFVRAISAYTPKEIEISDDRDVSEMSEREIDERIARLSEAIEERLGIVVEGEAGEGADQASPGVAGKLH